MKLSSQLCWTCGNAFAHKCQKFSGLPVIGLEFENGYIKNCPNYIRDKPPPKHDNATTTTTPKFTPWHAYKQIQKELINQ